MYIPEKDIKAPCTRMALFLSLNSNLRMFAPIVSANPYCTLYSCCNVTPYHK